MPESKQPELNPFEVEITNLDPPQRLEHTLCARVSYLLVRWQRPERQRARRWLNAAFVLGLVCTLLAILLSPAAGVTALLAAHWPFHASQTSQSARMGSSTLAPHTSDDILCPVQSAWSPDSSYIAILGYKDSCAQNNYEPAQIDLYDAATARRVISWQPDRAILIALQRLPGVSASTKMKLAHKPAPGMYSLAPAIEYLQMLWSPDSARLAVSFGAATRAMTYEGLFLTDRGGTHTQVLLEPEPQQFNLKHLPPLQWNLQRSSATSFKIPVPAQSYTWNTRNSLVPLSPLNASGHSSTYTALPPGNLSGGRMFSIWQPGRPIVLSLMHTPAAYLWESSFAAWSPDGHSLITNISVAGLMEPPGQAFPPPAALKDLEAQGVSRVPAHDPALIPASTSAQTVAWNPAGTLLAVYDLAGSVDLYDCQTGLFLRTLNPLVAHPLPDSTPPLLRWSPDGHALLLTSSQWGLVTLWKIGNSSHTRGMKK